MDVRTFHVCVYVCMHTYVSFRYVQLAHMPRKGENTLASRTTVHAETAGGFYDPVSLSVGGRNAAKALHSLVVVCLGAARRGERVGASGM